jgi:hypothetical protein
MVEKKQELLTAAIFSAFQVSVGDKDRSHPVDSPSGQPPRKRQCSREETFWFI